MNENRRAATRRSGRWRHLAPPSEDLLGAGARFLAAPDYQFIQANMPIACVDLVPLMPGRTADVGLILRQTYDGQTGWCLVGGRVLRNEPLTEAIARHVETTLGDQLRVVPESVVLRRVVEYFSDAHVGEFYDPRQHAVALTYTAVCEGEARPQGEAIDFAWFTRDDLPGLDFGFGQNEVLASVLAQLDNGGDQK